MSARQGSLEISGCRTLGDLNPRESQWSAQKHRHAGVSPHGTPDRQILRYPTEISRPLHAHRDCLPRRQRGTRAAPLSQSAQIPSGNRPHQTRRMRTTGLPTRTHRGSENPVRLSELEATCEVDNVPDQIFGCRNDVIPQAPCLEDGYTRPLAYRGQRLGPRRGTVSQRANVDASRAEALVPSVRTDRTGNELVSSCPSDPEH